MNFSDLVNIANHIAGKGELQYGLGQKELSDVEDWHRLLLYIEKIADHTNNDITSTFDNLIPLRQDLEILTEQISLGVPNASELEESSNYIENNNSEQTAFFNNADEMRWFFNSGGRIRVKVTDEQFDITSQAGGVNTWSYAQGTTEKGDYEFSKTKNTGTPYGFYNLTTNYTEIVNTDNINIKVKLNAIPGKSESITTLTSLKNFTPIKLTSVNPIAGHGLTKVYYPYDFK